MANSDFTLFYAWQSDSAADVNRNFIETAARKALKQIEKSGVVQASPRLDKDTKDVPGIPDIANTILDKIRSADAFLADISYVGTAFASGSESKEPIPNPNVMIELGYALAELGWERIVCVMNTQYGSQEQLPFDLRHRRWPITYQLPPGSDETERREAREALAHHLQDAIAAIASLPPRSKEATTLQRLDALENIVSALTTSVAQSAGLANAVADLQGRGVGDSPPTRGRQLCRKILKELQERVRGGEFEGVPSAEGAALLAICPTTPLTELVLLSGPETETMLRQKLRPFCSSGWDHRRHGDRFVTYSRRDKVVDAATEVTNTGILCAAGHDIVSVDKRHVAPTARDDVQFIPSVAFEKAIIESLSGYLQALRTLGVGGPWIVALGLVNPGKSFLFVGPFYAAEGRVHEGGEIFPKEVEVSEDTDLENPQAMARALQPAFDFVWREYNYPRSLNYNKSGEWVGH